MEESSKSIISPFFSLPPFAFLSFIFVSRYYFVRDPEVDDFEKKLTPRNDGLGALLVGTQVDANTCFVGFEDEMKHGRSFLCG